MTYFWLALVIFLIIIEACTSDLVTIWFVASGIVALILSLFVDNILVQTSIFIILGVILMITTRPILKKFLKVKNEPTNLDRVIGMKGIVTQDISPLNYGEVKVDGKKWTATSETYLKVDEEVKILEINGVKLTVKKWEE